MRGVRPSWHKGIIQPPTLPEDQRGRTPAGKLGNTPQATDGLVQCTLNFLEILLQERQLCEMRSHLCVCEMNLSSRHFRSWTPKLLLPGEVFDSSCVLLEGGDHIGPQDSQPPPPPHPPHHIPMPSMLPVSCVLHPARLSIYSSYPHCTVCPPVGFFPVEE